jgi:hypothetical protein
MSRPPDSAYVLGARPSCGSLHRPLLQALTSEAMTDQDMAIRTAAFEHIRRLIEVHDHLTAADLKPGCIFNGERTWLRTNKSLVL